MTTATKRRQQMPTTTYMQSRVVLFQPTKRPTRRCGDWQVTSWGRVRVTGRLGQRHADLLEAVCATSISWRRIDDGGIELLVDPYRLRRCMAAGRGKWGEDSQGQVQLLLTELCEALIEIVTPDLEHKAPGFRVVGHLIDHWIPSLDDQVVNPLGGTRLLWRARLGVALVELLRVDGKLWHDPAKIAALRFGVSKALARHVLTHRRMPPGGWWLDVLLTAIGVAASSQVRKQARRALRDDSNGLAALGITVRDGRVLIGEVSARLSAPPEGAQMPGEGAQMPGVFSSSQYHSGTEAGPLHGGPAPEDQEQGRILPISALTPPALRAGGDPCALPARGSLPAKGAGRLWGSRT